MNIVKARYTDIFQKHRNHKWIGYRYAIQLWTPFDT